MKLTFYGHACLRLQGERASLICDPWFATVPIYSDVIIKYPFVSRELAQGVYDCEHVYLSHQHEDHFHVPTLQRFPPSTQFHIPAFEYVDHPRGRSMEHTLRAMGFENINLWRSWESFSIDLGQTIRCTLIPSAETRSHDRENSGLLIRTDRHVLLDLNDNVADDGLLERIRAVAPKIDFAFVQGFQATEFPANFDLPIRDKLRIGRHKRGNVAEAQKIIDGLAPRFVSPVAADLCWFRTEDFYKNYSDKPNPSRFGPILAKAGALKTTKLLALEPGDAFSLADEPAVEQRSGRLKRFGFRRRLHRLSDRIREFSARTRRLFDRIPFDGSTVPAFVERAQDYFTRHIALPGPARIDFRITDDEDIARTLATFSLSANGGRTRVSLKPPAELFLDQEILVPSSIWMASCAGLVLRSNFFVLCVNRQLTPFRMEIAHLRYWFTRYADFGDISSWVRISPVAPQYADIYTEYLALLDSQPSLFEDAELAREYDVTAPHRSSIARTN